MTPKHFTAGWCCVVQGCRAPRVFPSSGSNGMSIGVNESIGDAAEALYYFESVTKRDAGFADAAMRSPVGRAQLLDDDL